MDNFFPHMTVYLGLVAGAFAISFLLIVFLDFKPQGRGDVQALILIFGGSLLLVQGLYLLVRRLTRKTPPAN